MSSGSADCNTGLPATIPPITSPSTAADAKELMGSLPTCTQSSYSASVKIGPGALGGTAKMSGNVSVGCQQIAIAVAEYTNTKKTINCIINKNVVTLDAAASTSQKIIFNNYGTVTTKSLTIVNKAQALVVLKAAISTTAASTIVSAVQDTVNSTLDAIQSASEESGTNTTGQQSLSLAKTAISNLVSSTSITDNVIKITANAVVGQEITINNYAIITSDTFNIENDSVIEMTVTGIINSVTTSMMELSDVTSYINSMKTTQKAKSAVSGTEIAMYVGIAVAGVAVTVGIVVAIKAFQKSNRAKRAEQQRLENSSAQGEGDGTYLRNGDNRRPLLNGDNGETRPQSGSGGEDGSNNRAVGSRGRQPLAF